MIGIAKRLSKARNRALKSAKYQHEAIQTSTHRIDLTAGTLPSTVDDISLSPLTVHADRQGPPVLFFGLQTIQIDLIQNLELVGQVGS
jgi:hypothetical protein